MPNPDPRTPDEMVAALREHDAAMTAGTLVVDFRVGAIRVYPGPRVNCFGHFYDKRVLFRAGGCGVRDEGGHFYRWETHSQDVADAIGIAFLRNNASAIADLIEHQQERLRKADAVEKAAREYRDYVAMEGDDPETYESLSANLVAALAAYREEQR